MNAILGVDGIKPAWFTYACPVCKFRFDKDHKRQTLTHPTHDGWIFKGKRIECEHAGKVFEIPTQTVQLKEA